MDLPFLYIMLLPKLPSVDRQNALPTVMVVHTLLLLTKELTAQARSSGQWSDYAGSTGVTCLQGLVSGSLASLVPCNLARGRGIH